MKIFKDVSKVFMRSKLFLITTLLTICFSVKYAIKYYGYEADIGMISTQLNQTLKTSFYLFFVVMFLAYEFYMKFQHNGIQEVAAVTEEGSKKKHLFCAFCTMTVWIVLITICLSVCTIISFKYYKVPDSNGYIIHIIENMMVNIFLILELGSLIGLLLSKTRKRILSYAVILLVIYGVSPYVERIADAQAVSGNVTHSIYPLVELFNIMPLVNSGFPTMDPFGENILFYRVSLILFWIMAVLTFIFWTNQASKKKMAVSILAMACFFYGYAAPASRVNMNGNPANTMAHDQYYYETDDQPTKVKVEKANYSIPEYKMSLKVGRQLSAKVEMKVNKSLNSYKMTLYHGYKVKKACDQKGNKLSFGQKNDYILVKNQGREPIEKITLEYEGASASYYSNNQGIYLPGDFAYYPRAGYVALHDDEGMKMTSCFVNKKTKFDLKVSTRKKIYTNLQEKDGVYAGISDGATIFSGFYREKKFGNGNRLVYPYISDFYYAKDQGLEKICDEDEKELERLGKSGVTVFVAPNVNQMRTCDIGENQILVRMTPYF